MNQFCAYRVLPQLQHDTLKVYNQSYWNEHHAENLFEKEKEVRVESDDFDSSRWRKKDSMTMLLPMQMWRGMNVPARTPTKPVQR